jgi:Tfp pilus assembly protein PilZ
MTARASVGFARPPLSRRSKRQFGEKVKVIDTTLKVRGGAIRYFKKRGIPVTKTAGKFYIDAGTKMLVMCKLDVPIDFFTRAAARVNEQGADWKTEGIGVDLTELDGTSEAPDPNAGWTAVQESAP